MTNHYYDRISGIPSKIAPCHDVAMGQWMLLREESQSLVLNTVIVKNWDYLIPDLSGNWRLTTSDNRVESGGIIKSQLIDELYSESIVAISQHLNELIHNEAGWIEWLDVAPLVPRMSEAVELTNLEIMVQQKFGYLESVCYKPRTHLRVKIERVPVSIARRVPSEAWAFLASHTEDWEHLGLDNVLPKRVLSEVRDDKVDIYENRVTARLIDNLSLYLNRRIQSLKGMIKLFEDKEDYSSEAKGTHWRQKRIHEIWGKSIDSNEGRLKAERTLKELYRLKYKIMGLMDSPLYQEIPKRTYIDSTLKRTNIFVNEPSYIQVALLWHEWLQADIGRVISPKENYVRMQSICLGFSLFSVLLVIRALQGLGYEPCDEDIEKPICANSSLFLEHGSSYITLSWHPDNTLELNNGSDSLRIVPLPVDLSNSANDSEAELVINDIVGCANDSRRVMTIYSSVAYEDCDTLSIEKCWELYTTGVNPKYTKSSMASILPASPWDIGSVERVARGIRWFADSPRLLAYPHVAICSKKLWEFLNLVSEKCISANENYSQIHIIRPPYSYELDQRRLDKVIMDESTKLRKLTRQHEIVSDELKRKVKTDRKSGTLRQQKSRLHEEELILKKRIALLTTFCDEVNEAVAYTHDLLKCPVCGANANEKDGFKFSDNGCFICNCADCGASWGTRYCGNRHKYPVMLPVKFIDTEDVCPGWMDRIYGQDLLALPAKEVSGQWGFMCPVCGDVT